MKVVIDCNILVSAARIDGVCRKVIDRVVRQHEIVLSEPILTEYETVAERPKHALYHAALQANIGEIKRRCGTDYGQQSGFHGATLRIGRGFFAAFFSGANDMTNRAAVWGENVEGKMWSRDTVDTEDWD